MIALETLDRNIGHRITLDRKWVGTVWHSGIWGWQWARLAGEHGEVIGGQCETEESGVEKIKALLS